MDNNTRSGVAGHHWYANGQSALSGPALQLFNALDRLFVSWSKRWQADEYQFPPFLPVSELDKLDYFASFPHLATFPVTLEQDADNLRKFSAQPLAPSGEIQLTECCNVADVLTPAACYHFYVLLQQREIERTMYLTTRTTCHRREEYYAPLQRQWSFPMREIVCIGSETDVQEYLTSAKAMIDAFTREIRFPITWEKANDPFFDPEKNTKFVAQKLLPLKTELVFGDELAIASINYHQTYFGDTFDIKLEGSSVHSGCVAFGVERWIHAITTHFGPSESDWPEALVEAQ